MGTVRFCRLLQLMFFRSGDNPCEVLDGENGLLFVHQADGRATGDAFVLFSNEDDANKALSKHRQCISTRYIELFKSTTAEVQQVKEGTSVREHCHVCLALCRHLYESTESKCTSNDMSHKIEYYIFCRQKSAKIP